MPEQQLHRTQVLGTSVDQRSLRASHGMSAVGRAIEANLSNPVVNDPRVLPGGKVRRGMHSAWEQKRIVTEVCCVYPLVDCLTRQISDLELDRSLGLLLYD